MEEIIKQHASVPAERVHGAGQAPGQSNHVIALVNRNKSLIQWAIALLGIIVLASLGNAILSRVGGGPVNGRALKHLLEAAAEPAQLGLPILIGGYLVRLSLKLRHPFKELGRIALRILQVVHVPVAVIITLAAGIHGSMFAHYLWRSNREYWSGVVALVGMVAVGLLGLGAFRGRKSKAVHLATSLLATGLIVMHMAMA